MIESRNPADNTVLKTYEEISDEALAQKLETAQNQQKSWKQLSYNERATMLRRAGDVLRDNIEPYARIMTQEMGKPITEARAEVQKCAMVCDYYAGEAENFLDDEIIESDASKSLVAYQPLGVILIVMPWNYPLWQVFRQAAPALMSGNTLVLKHASNVPQCAEIIENVFTQAGFPAGCFTNLFVTIPQVEQIMAHNGVKAVALTGSDRAGRSVASLAGKYLKPSVMELGGSDAFVVCADADLDWAIEQAIASRFLNTGQSCIAAKRFILLPEIADEFIARFKAAAEQLIVGNPMDDDTRIGPMARVDLRDEMQDQVNTALEQGATLVTGGHAVGEEGAFFEPTILDNVQSNQEIYYLEMFGPTALVIRAKDEQEAVEIANDSPFGLGGSIWTQNIEKGEAMARQLECGCAFVNGMVKSDPRLPFGGIKESGYGRELSHHGIKEFCNTKTVWIK